ncbi:MAG: hypothetical protein U9N38_05665 [Thermodesulfobacteriota bacterium]|nr:hypothetical protein [Thermodesulfobacteriota bacterium]
MASKDKAARDNQETYWKVELSRRLGVLKEGGVEPGKIAKDAAVRKIRAEIRKVGARLAVIDKKQKKMEKMARIKVEKMSIPKEKKMEKAKEEKSSEESKRQQKLKKKMEKKEEKKLAKE